jgi:ubiquinone/menaquinone biosynthesis C-methylase UbiE
MMVRDSHGRQGEELDLVAQRGGGARRVLISAGIAMLHASAHVTRLVEVVFPLNSRVPRVVRRPLVNAFFTTTCRRILSKDIVRFLNFGYLSDPAQLDGSVDIVDRVSELLYERVVGNVDLAGKALVEVGCGSGAGSAHLARTYHPASLIGIDFNKDLVSWCCTQHHEPNLKFQQGDAEDLPIADDSVDAVVNVESSHCYPSRLKFFEEVARVLRPGGSFLFADIMLSYRNGEEADAVSAQLQEAGLRIDDRVDITSSVLAAREAVSKSDLRSHIRAELPPLMVPFAEEAFCLTDTNLYKEMLSRRAGYVQWKAAKPLNGEAT